MEFGFDLEMNGFSQLSFPMAASPRCETLSSHYSLPVFGEERDQAKKNLFLDHRAKART